MQSLDPTYPLYPTFAFIAFLISVIPLPWHIQAWNAGTCMYMIWTATSCLIEFVNSMVWKGHALNLAPIWCDISSKLLVGTSVGIPAAALCIARRLYIIASVQSASITRSDKQRAVICDLSISIGLPVLVMILHVVVQAHRFDILQEIGCYPVIYNTLPAYFLVFQWPVTIGCISFVYSALALRQFWLRRIQFSQLISSNTSLNASRYFRLMILAICNMLFTLPLGIYSIYIGNKGVKLAPWISWEETHFNFARVVQIPAVIWRSDPDFVRAVELTRWIYVVSALVFFALFGFANEAKKNYREAFWFVAKHFGFKRSEAKKTVLPLWRKPVAAKLDDSKASIPSFVNRHPSPNPPKELSLQFPVSSTTLARTNSRWSSSTLSNIEKSTPLTPPTPTSPPPQYPTAQTPHLGSNNSNPTLPPRNHDRASLNSADFPSDVSSYSGDSVLDLRSPDHVQLPPLSSTDSAFTIRSMHSLDRVFFSHTGDDVSPSSESSSTPSPISRTTHDVPAYHLPIVNPSKYPHTVPHMRRDV